MKLLKLLVNNQWYRDIFDGQFHWTMPVRVTPRQYILPDFDSPPYSSQIPGQDRHVGSNNEKSSNACDTNPETSTSLWLNAGGLFFSWQMVTPTGSSQ